ncbi:DUF5658 family protein [Mesobacillus harenae]|uniref:DUF5658 family protein n=1 Tax=Mesobacillus harenae TaxID=2213203 RepID=UPI0015801BB2|nr:DUF5658 family protein [Mesobacillus harenae]
MIFLFHYLSTLNIVDAVLTFVGLENALIEEANPLMSQIYSEHPFLFIFVKLSLSFLLYLFIIYKKVPNSKVTKGLTVIASVFYTITFIVHCIWITLL